jgi:hypothetical protein
MYEDIGSIFTSDKSISLCVVEPLDGSFQSIHSETSGHELFAAEAVPTDFAVIVRLRRGTVKRIQGLFTLPGGSKMVGEPQNTGDGLGIFQRLIADHR